MKNHFLQAPEEHVPKGCKNVIKLWSSPPTPQELKDTLLLFKQSGASEFAVNTLTRYMHSVLGRLTSEKQK